MTLKRIILNGLIFLFLLANLAGIEKTLLGYIPRWMPLHVTEFTYGMMAPYQTYSTINRELAIEGRKKDGDWERIPLSSYIPYWKGERAYRGFLPSFRFYRGEKMLAQNYELFAKKILEYERRHGNDLESVRLLWHEWPASPESFEALRFGIFLSSSVLTQVP